MRLDRVLDLWPKVMTGPKNPIKQQELNEQPILFKRIVARQVSAHDNSQLL